MVRPQLETRFSVSDAIGEVSAVLSRPTGADALLVLGHGAGAGMQHAFMVELAACLSAHRIASFRYQFPYVEKGQRRPSPRPVLLATVAATIHTAGELARDLPLFAGGKSMGGRMTSLLCTKNLPAALNGLVFVGFPLHPAGKPGNDRGRHLEGISLPMLFLQGTRDRLAMLDLLTPLCASLAPVARLHVVDEADHSFAMTKRSGRTQSEVLDELAGVVASWMDQCPIGQGA